MIWTVGPAVTVSAMHWATGRDTCQFTAPTPVDTPPLPSRDQTPASHPQACRLAIEAQTLSALLALFAASQDAAARAAPDAPPVAWPLVALTLRRALQEVEAQAAACRGEGGEQAPPAVSEGAGAVAGSEPGAERQAPGAPAGPEQEVLPPLPPEPAALGEGSDQAQHAGPVPAPQWGQASLLEAPPAAPSGAAPTSSIESAEMEDVSDGEGSEPTAPPPRSTEGSGDGPRAQGVGNEDPVDGAAPGADPQRPRVKKKRRQEGGAISGLGLSRHLGKSQVARWQEVQRKAQEEERQEEARELGGGAANEAERARQAEEWRLQQLRTGAADGNANFAVGG